MPACPPPEAQRQSDGTTTWSVLVHDDGTSTRWSQRVDGSWRRPVTVNTRDCEYAVPPEPAEKADDGGGDEPGAFKPAEAAVKVQAEKLDMSAEPTTLEGARRHSLLHNMFAQYERKLQAGAWPHGGDGPQFCRGLVEQVGPFFAKGLEGATMAALDPEVVAGHVGWDVVLRTPRRAGLDFVWACFFKSAAPRSCSSCPAVTPARARQPGAHVALQRVCVHH